MNKYKILPRFRTVGARPLQAPPRRYPHLLNGTEGERERKREIFIYIYIQMNK